MKKLIPALAIAAIALGLSGSAALAKESGNRGDHGSDHREERVSEHRDRGDRSGDHNRDHRESRDFDRNMMIDWDNDSD